MGLETNNLIMTNSDQFLKTKAKNIPFTHLAKNRNLITYLQKENFLICVALKIITLGESRKILKIYTIIIIINSKVFE